MSQEADIAARAKKNADALRNEQEHAVVKPLSATAPVTEDNVWVLDLSDGGHVRIQLRPDVAPEHVVRIKELTRKHFYDGLASIA